MLRHREGLLTIIAFAYIRPSRGRESDAVAFGVRPTKKGLPVPLPGS